MSRPTSVLSSVLAAGLAVILAPSFVNAQQRIEITPFIASYYAVSHLDEGSNGVLVGNDFTLDQSNAFTFGGRLSVPVGARFAVEGEFVYSLSGVRFTEVDIAGSTDGGFAFEGNVIFASVRGVLSPRRSNIFFLAGPAIVSRGGDAWDGFASEEKTDFGGVVGFGIRANVTPKFRLNLTAESYLTSFSFVGSSSKLQADVIVAVGVPISLGGR